jgi:hypothetical protein
MLIEEKLDDTGARLEHTKSQETGVSKSSARTTQFLKLKPYKTKVIHTCVAATLSS